MKRLLAILLTGCLILQPVSGAGAAVWGADFSSEDTAAVPEESGGAAGSELDLSAEAADDLTSDTGTDAEILSEELPQAVPEETPSEDPLSGEIFQEETEKPAGDEFTVDAVEDTDGEFLPETLEDPLAPDPQGEDIFGDVTEEEDSENGPLWEAPVTSNGYLQVKLNSSLPFTYLESGVPVTISVWMNGVFVTETVKKLGNEQGFSATAEFELAPGTYDIKVSADKFADYEQTVAIKEYQISKIEVCSAKVKTGVENVTSGWMRLGDVTHDNKIDEKDVERVLDYVRTDEYYLDANVTMGIDSVEEVDISDLQYVIQSYDQEQMSSVVELSKPRAFNAMEGTKVEGSVEEVLSGEGNLTLQPAQADEPISPENPVAVEFALADEDTPVEELPRIDGMTIGSVSTDENGNTTSDISRGRVEYVYVDAEGNEQTGYVDIGEPEEAVTAAPADEEELFGVPSEEEILDEIPEGDLFEEPSGEELFGDPLSGEDGAFEEDGFDLPASDEEMVDEPALFLLGSVLFPSVRVNAETKAPSVDVEPDGSLVLNFGTQVAVKRVTIKITGTTKKNQKLVDIAKVEFVNEMDKRIPAPSLSIPEFNEPVTDSEEFTVSWTPQQNVTGYELSITGPVKKDTAIQTQVVRLSDTQHLVVMINDKSIMNFKEYKLKVRSVNGDWTSPWSEELIVRPEPKAVPEPVDNLVGTGGYRLIRATWKDMKDAEGYMLYYREVTEADTGKTPDPAADDTFIPVVEGFQRVPSGEGMLTTNSFIIEGLKDGTEYFLYVVGWNALGWGKPSLVGKAETKTGNNPRLPEYNLINTSLGEGVVSANIESAIHGDHGNAKMHGSPIDDEKQAQGGTGIPNSYWAFGVVDNDYSSYWMKPNEWDDGISYLDPNYARGITVTLNDEYEMSYLTFAAADLNGEPNYARILYWNDENGDTRLEVGADLLKMTDESKNRIYIVRFHAPIKARKVMMCLGTGYTRIDMKVAEMHFHRYDGVEQAIYDLYADEMHSRLVEGVTEDQIDLLEEQLNTPDEVSGELHPLYSYLVLELKNARDLLSMEDVETVSIDNRITARKDGHVGFGGLNAWQPLGRTVFAGEKIIIFVGHNFKKVGDPSDLSLVFTQYHAESNQLSRSVALKIGKNELEVPYVANTAYENGGQIYIAYNGNNTTDQYGVRVSGGVKIPTLNLYKKEGQEKKDAIRKYVLSLESYVKNIEKNHAKIHQTEQSKSVNYDYDKKLCVLNATDILMEYMMYSIPATQAWAGLSDEASTDERVDALEKALDAMENTMLLFYQHKGLTDLEGSSKNGNNMLPSRHLNIRYMRMFAGAFMYASGDHIGIEYPETAMATGAASWDSFGWGIGHEIGHDINEGKYAIAEITNNYFAQLITIKNGLRFKFPDVYKKVTSGEIGRSSNGAVQLALYWQLHLMFDDHLDERQIFTDYDQMFNDVFFARVDTYSRNPGKAPKQMNVIRNGKEVNILSANDDVDNNLMRLACAAANANILPFFERWGMMPPADSAAYAAKQQAYDDTVAYANLYGEPTDKALYYVNDAARDYRAQNPGGAGIAGQTVASAQVESYNNYATLHITTTADPDLILGYEIIRGMYADGVMSREVVGFTECTGVTTDYVDTVSTVNNRVMYYQVKPVDKYLNYGNAVSAGSVKIETGGALNKDLWEIESMMTSLDDVEIVPDKDDPDRGQDASKPGNASAGKVNSAERIIDGNLSTVYNSTDTTGVLLIDLGKVEEITSLIYRGSDLTSISVYAYEPDVLDSMKTLKAGYTDCRNCSDKGATVWFDPENPELIGSFIGTYDAQYLMIELASDAPISISEIEICGPAGDNVEFRTGGGNPAVGVLSADYRYAGKNGADDYFIPKDSLVFVGKYQGNPAYNVVILYDEEGNVIGASGEGEDAQVNAEQIIFAEVPARGDLGETSDGTWVYYVRPENWNAEMLSGIKGGVRAELYRVDNAETLEGERIVSDTVIYTMPAELPKITFEGGRIPDAE